MEKIHDLMFCPECGVKLEGDEIICSICGHRIVATPQADVPPTVLPPVVPEIPKADDPFISQNPVKKHDLAFCPECGVKLDGDETLCSICSYRLAPTTENPFTTKSPEITPTVVPETLVAEQTVVSIPIVETPVIEQPLAPVVEVIPLVTIASIEKKHDLMFCPECGQKLQGDEVLCPKCLFKLIEEPMGITPSAPPVPEPVIEPSVMPIPPVIEEPVKEPISEIAPPVVETPAIEQPLAPVVEVIPPVTNASIEKKHDLMFCPECGQKLQGDEVLCPKCLYKLVEEPVDTTTPAPPVPEPVIEPSVIPIPPVIEEPVKEPISEIAPPVVETPLVKVHDLLFCPECGNKLLGDEVICPKCGYRLSGTPANIEPPITIPPGTPPAQPPVNVYTPPVTNVYAPNTNQPQYQAPIKKKKTGLIIFLILFFVIVLGGGTVAFLQYNGNINIPFLESVIPQKGSNSSGPIVTDHTRYYVCHSFAAVGTKMTVIVSGTIVSKKPYNNKDGAIVQFKKAISKKFPNDYINFTTVLCDQYKTYPEATSGRTATLKGYDAGKYDIKTVDVNY